jgi:hypothetical protein
MSGFPGDFRGTLILLPNPLLATLKILVDGRGFEPPTPALRTRCSPN